ncbi:MAG: hypothetical protein MRJ92_00235 [Nitrospira sp.]|nr:hypothetical protein [Nitrospira sp.]
MSIAWAIAEFIQDPVRLRARTLFATHYHEMTQLEGLREGITNYSVAVQERNGRVLFLRKIIPGGADRSYGIHGSSWQAFQAVLHRAKAVLLQLRIYNFSKNPFAKLNRHCNSTLPCLRLTPCWRKSGRWISSL